MGSEFKLTALKISKDISDDFTEKMRSEFIPAQVVVGKFMEYYISGNFFMEMDFFLKHDPQKYFVDEKVRHISKINPEVYAQFKKACKERGHTMSKVIEMFMKLYCEGVFVLELAFKGFNMP